MHYCLRLPSLAAKDLKEFVKTGRWEEAREFLNDRAEGCTDQAGDKHGSSPPEYNSHNGFELARAARLGRSHTKQDQRQQGHARHNRCDQIRR